MANLDTDLIMEKEGELYSSEEALSRMKEDSGDSIVGFSDSDVYTVDDKELSNSNFIFGEDGYGKSNFLVNIALQRIYRNDNICFISNQESTHQILESLSDEELLNVSYLNPFDSRFESKEEIIQRGICRTMSESGEYSLRDLLEILSDLDSIKQFTRDFEKSENEIHMERIRDMHEKEFDSFRKDVEREVEKIEEAFDSSRIVLVDMLNVRPEMKHLIIQTLIEEFENLLDLDGEKLHFFLDDFEEYQNLYDRINSIINQDKERVFFYAACESLHQLDKDVRESIFESVGNIYSFRIPEDKNPEYIAYIMGVEIEDIYNMEPYEFRGTLHGSKITSLPPVFPKRDAEDTEII